MARQRKHWNDIKIGEIVAEPYLDPSKQWRKVTHTDKHYFISNDGDCYSAVMWRLLKGQTRKINTQFYKNYNLNHQWYSAHILVMMCFGEEQPSIDHEVNHKDGNGINNHINNLEWLTHSQNIQHSFDNGRKRYEGADHWRYGKKASEETRRKQSITKIGANHPKFKGYFVVFGCRYSSASEASLKSGVPAKVLAKRCRFNPDHDYYFSPVERIPSVK